MSSGENFAFVNSEDRDSENPGCSCASVAKPDSAYASTYRRLAPGASRPP